MTDDVKIKICGITSAEDGLIAAEAGADAIGLMFFRDSPRWVSVETAEQISAKLPPHLMRVGVFVNPDEELVSEAIRRCGLTLLQFHGDESPEFCAQFGVMTMKALRVQDAASLEAISAYGADSILLDSHVKGQRGGTGAAFNWDLAVEAKKFGKPIFLAGGLTPENAAEAVRKTRPFGVDVSSGVESSPGKKDADKVRRFIAAVRGA